MANMMSRLLKSWVDRRKLEQQSEASCATDAQIRNKAAHDKLMAELSKLREQLENSGRVRDERPLNH